MYTSSKRVSFSLKKKFFATTVTLCQPSSEKLRDIRNWSPENLSVTLKTPRESCWPVKLCYGNLDCCSTQQAHHWLCWWPQWFQPLPSHNQRKMWHWGLEVAGLCWVLMLEDPDPSKDPWYSWSMRWCIQALTFPKVYTWGWPRSHQSENKQGRLS